MNRNSEISSKVQEVQILKQPESDIPFDIVEFCKTSKIQISSTKYLRLNLKELEKLIKYVQRENFQLQPSDVLTNIESLPFNTEA